MKKICLLCLLAISMSFASLKVEGYYCLGEQEFQLVNKNGKKIQGFKIILYRNAYDTSKGIKISKGSNLGGAKASLERVSAQMYKIELDFSNATIPAGGTFPSDGGYLWVDLASLDDGYVGPRVLAKCAYVRDEMPNTVVISSGKILWGEYKSVPSEKRIGLLKKGADTKCSDWFKPAGEVSIYLEKSLFIWIQRIAIMKMV